MIVALVAFVLMEPIAALTHRWLMHGRGWRWHRSHHATRGRRLEANDLFPMVFAVATIVVMAVGAAADRPLLLWAGAGVTVYGTAYLLVHDVCIHGRLGRAVVAGPYLRWVARAHAVHHRDGRAPYGFLVPIVPTDRLGRDRSADDVTVASFRPSDRRARRVKTS